LADPRLGRIPKFDPRSLNYNIRGLVQEVPQEVQPQHLRSYTWGDSDHLDQGQCSGCVGFGISGDLAANPVPVHGIDNKYAEEGVYWNIQRADDYPGGEYPGASPQSGGTSVTDGMRWAKSQGWYLEYRWATNELDLAYAVGHIGPAIIGVNWYESMMDTDKDGNLEISGSVIGGHCVLVRGIHVMSGGKRRYRIRNSWSAQWGMDGDAWITSEDMDRLMHEDGEFAIPTRRNPAKLTVVSDSAMFVQGSTENTVEYKPLWKQQYEAEQTSVTGTPAL